MIEIDLINKGFCIFGSRGGGKSVLLRWLAMQFAPRSFVYDPVDDIPETSPIVNYEPRDRYSVAEFEIVMRRVTASNAFNFIAVDEASRYCPSKPTPLPEIIGELNDMFRHKEYGYGAPLAGELTMGYLARRPVQLNQDITEIMEWLFIFNLRGNNDRSYLNGLSEGLGDQAVKLEPYHYLVVYPDRSYKISAPVDLAALEIAESKFITNTE